MRDEPAQPHFLGIKLDSEEGELLRRTLGLIRCHGDSEQFAECERGVAQRAREFLRWRDDEEVVHIMNDHSRRAPRVAFDREDFLEQMVQRGRVHFPQSARGAEPEGQHTLVVPLVQPLEAEQRPVLAADGHLLVRGLHVELHQPAAFAEFGDCAGAVRHLAELDFDVANAGVDAVAAVRIAQMVNDAQAAVLFGDGPDGRHAHHGEGLLRERAGLFARARVRCDHG